MIVTDFRNKQVRFPAERQRHVGVRHPYLPLTVRAITLTLQQPEEVRRSSSDPATVLLYYRLLEADALANRYICVVVKDLPDDAFIVTAYPADSLKPGDTVYEKTSA